MNKKVKSYKSIISNPVNVNHAEDLVISLGEELVTAYEDKAKRANELVTVNKEKAKLETELINANKKLIFQNSEKGKRAEELIIANIELTYQNSEKAKRVEELIIANQEKAQREKELIIINKELTIQIERRNESELKSRSIMENSADAIFLTNQQGKYIYTNKAVTAMLGYSSEEMINKTIADISPPNRIEEYFDMFKRIISEGKVFTELELLKKDGSYISTDLNSVLLPDGMIYGSCRDITERKKAESDLIKAKEKAEENDRLKSAFLSNMSHEIRTPMNGILGFTELLREPNLTIDEQQDFIQTIQISGERMLNTINNIVNVSKIEAGLMNLDIKETNINEKMEFTYKFFKPEVERKGLQFVYKNGLSSAECMISTDNEKVYAVLTNLVKNAIKFTRKGSIEFGYEKKGNYLEFFVKDSGTGINKNQIEIVFERFRQGSESNDRGYEGSGLGLSIAKSYIEMLDGKIWLESEEGKGSVFYFTIPYNPASEYIVNKNVVPEKAIDVELKTLKILIVEDDEISYSLLRRNLNDISSEVLHSITGFEAVETCRSNTDLDLVLMDIRMPGMNGIDATREIRTFNKEIIIIAQTACAFSTDSEKAIEAGCDDYISKPIDKTVLFDLIKKHVNKSGINDKKISQL